MNINHRVGPTHKIPSYTSHQGYPRNQQNQQTQTKKQVTNPAPFLKFLEQLFKPEKKGEIQNGK